MLARDQRENPGASRPYLSVVATARNDDHGGNLLGRMQIFTDAWINQAKRHKLSSELILVEWNPPADREGLAAALRWPVELGPCQVRIIEVPAEIHARYHHASSLALYQMIAKNVGIRRARGEFILATNIDIVFSDELMQFLATRGLEKNRLYRIDRTDVASEAPVNGSLDEQLEYCRNHVIRICAREGTYKTTPEGFRRNEAEDITSADSGIHFGSGWFSAERWGDGAPFRWIADEAEIQLAKAPAGGGVLALELECGPGIDRDGATLKVRDGWGSMVVEFGIKGRTKLELVVPARVGPGAQSFRFEVEGGGQPVPGDPRILNFRVFRCDWAHRQSEGVKTPSAGSIIRECRPLLTRLLLAGGIARQFGSGFPGALAMLRAIRLLRARGEDVFDAGMEYRTGSGWHDLERAGGERFRWVSGGAQMAVRMTDERHSLALIVEPGPALGFQPFDLVIRDASGNELGRERVNGVTFVDVPLPVAAGTLVTLTLDTEGGGKRVGNDPRELHFRVHACGTCVKKPEMVGAAEARPPRFWIVHEVEARAAEADWTEILGPSGFQIAAMGKPRFLHMNACGDFTLAARENWYDLRGYPELDLFSMHLDALFCCTAHHSGVVETCFEAPMRIYHIEHGIGSGWTPEGQAQLYERLAKKRIQCVSYEEVVWSIAQMRSLSAPVIFNLEDWGLAGTPLSETSPAMSSSAPGVRPAL